MTFKLFGSDILRKRYRQKRRFLRRRVGRDIGRRREDPIHLLPKTRIRRLSPT